MRVTAWCAVLLLATSLCVTACAPVAPVTSSTDLTVTATDVAPASQTSVTASSATGSTSVASAATGGQATAALTVPGTFIVEPDDGVGPVLNAISSAHATIDMTMYLLTYRDVISGLSDAAKRGVKVRALLEENPVGGSSNQSLYNELKGDGITVAWSNPQFRLTHEKALVIDGREAVIMTMNLTFSAFTKNREYGMIDTAPADVAATESIFQADWDRKPSGAVPADMVVAPDNARQKLIALIGQAHQSLLAEQEEMQDDGVEQALAAAAKRGVHVQLIVPAPDTGSDPNAAGESLLSHAGVLVRKLPAPYPHAKMYLIDGHELYVGSANASTSSLDDTRELGLLMVNPDAIARVQAAFAKDWDGAAA